MAAAHEKASDRYPVSLQLCYSNRRRMLGFGQTRMMSTQDIVFAPGHGLEPGMNAEIVVAWPPFRHDGTLLELVLEVSITDSKGGVAEARILTYDFRTASPREGPEQILLLG